MHAGAVIVEQTSLPSLNRYPGRRRDNADSTAFFQVLNLAIGRNEDMTGIFAYRHQVAQIKRWILELQKRDHVR